MPSRGSFLSRYPSTNVPVFAIGAAVYGALMAASSDNQYRAKVYESIFQIAPRVVWGVVFVVVGVAVLVKVNLATTLALTATLFLWSALIFASLITNVGDVPFAAPVLPCSMSVALGLSVSRRGIRSIGSP